MRWLIRSGLRVLMYHKTSSATADEHTVTAGQLALQLRWLGQAGFQFIGLSDILRDVPPPRHSVLVTFDDGYLDTFEVARPVLRTLGVPATVFVPTAFIGLSSSWDRDARPLMDGAHLRALAAEGFDLALHSHRHENYATLPPERIADDLGESLAAFARLGLAVAPALAYPYGGRPRDSEARDAMYAALRARGVRLAFRIGNRVNSLPLTHPFEVERLSVRGDEPLGAFQRRVRWGRLL